MNFTDRVPSLRRNYYRRVRNAFVVAGVVHLVAFVAAPAYRPSPPAMRSDPLRLLPSGSAGARGIEASVAGNPISSPAPLVRTSPLSGVVPAREREVVSEQWTPQEAGTAPSAAPGQGASGGGGGALEEEAPPVYYGYDTPPRALRTFEPAYPTAAKASGFEGTVVININLDERGSILRAWVASANAPELLISTALDAVYQFRFAPGLARGVPVRCTVAVPFRFFLKRTT